VRSILRAEIDYGFREAKTTYGIIGVKVWVYKGDAPERASSLRPLNREKRGKKSGVKHASSR